MPHWWQDAVFYQVYPRSFQDSSGDGVGDLPGLRSRLEHISWLGVGAVWLSPVYRSPMRDFGYDVSDHCAVAPTFGDLDDVDALIRDAHEVGIRVVVDLVPSHTSNDHPWFVRSRSDRRSPLRNWYVWRDGRAPGHPPNNWRSVFGHDRPAWTFDPATDQWYLHTHLPEQPDLNWDNPEVHDAVAGIMRFWLDRGVDGFRVDSAQALAKDPTYADVSPVDDRERQRNWPTVHERVRLLRKVVDEYPDRVLIGEVWPQDLNLIGEYLREHEGFHLVHNFVPARLPFEAAPWHATLNQVAGLARGAWPAWLLNDHDLPRITSRLDGDGHGDRRARLAAMLLLTLRGTPFLYQGEELGLRDVPVPADQRVDPEGRDPQRAPIPWQPAGPGHGFTTGTPWLPLPDDADQRCVQSQRERRDSMLWFYRSLLRLRRRDRTLRQGSFRLLPPDPAVLGYVRTLKGRRVTILLNMTPERVTPAAAVRALTRAGRVLLDTDGGSATGVPETLGPLHGLIAELPAEQTRA